MIKQKTFNLLAGVIFAIAAFAHLVRAILVWPLFIGPISISVGVSVVAFLVATYLSWSAFKLNKQNI
jgi:hypothetical protein